MDLKVKITTPTTRNGLTAQGVEQALFLIPPGIKTVNFLIRLFPPNIPK